MKKVTLIVSFLFACLNIVFVTACTDTTAQTAYRTNAQATTPDAAECDYTFEKEQNKKALERAKSQYGRTLEVAPPRPIVLPNAKEPDTKRVKFVRAANKK